jgi:hypothetical protein
MNEPYEGQVRAVYTEEKIDIGLIFKNIVISKTVWWEQYHNGEWSRMPEITVNREQAKP